MSAECAVVQCHSKSPAKKILHLDSDVDDFQNVAGTALSKVTSPVIFCADLISNF